MKDAGKKNKQTIIIYDSGEIPYNGGCDFGLPHEAEGKTAPAGNDHETNFKTGRTVWLAKSEILIWRKAAERK